MPSSNDTAARHLVVDGVTLAPADTHNRQLVELVHPPGWVNDRLQTSNPKIYAAGDVCSPYKFTHAADAMARDKVTSARHALAAHSRCIY